MRCRDSSIVRASTAWWVSAPWRAGAGRLSVALVLLLAAAASGGCRSDEGESGGGAAPGRQTAMDAGGGQDGGGGKDGGGAAEQRATSLTGVLHSGIAAIGGETTGWRLAGDGQTGGIEVDVSAVADAARAHDGKRVTVTGRMVDRDYTERGKVPVLVAERIEPAPEPGEDERRGR